MKSVHHVARWMGGLSLLVVLAACGGGGGSSSGNPAPAPVPPAPDARNGSYTLVAADAREYTLALDFDAKTYHVTGNGVDTSGAVSEQAGVFSFAPGNATGASGSSTTRFTVATDAVIGELPLLAETVPFVASRKFLTSVADVAGTYNFVGRIVDTAGGPADTLIQQGEITTGGQFRTCDDAVIYEIVNCPPASVGSGTITVSGDVFSANVGPGTVHFRVAQIGTDKVFLRASASNGSTRRFIVGTPATVSFASDTFLGGSTEPAWGTVTIAGATYASSGTSPSGTTTAVSGTADPVTTPPPGSSIGGMRIIDAGADGIFFAIRSSELGVVVASQGSGTAAGFTAIGKKQ